MTIQNKHDLAVYSVNIEIARLAEDEMSKDIAVLDASINEVVEDLAA